MGTGQDQDRFGTSPGRLASFIREERARRSLSRRDLAEMVCGAARIEGERNARVSETTVKRWEQGQVPSQSHMRWLAGALRQPVGRLVALARQSPAGRVVPGPLDAAVDEERLVFAREHPHEIDAQSIDDLATLTHTYASRAQSVAPGELLVAVAALMRRLRSLLAGSHPDGVRRRLLALYAESAAMAGRLAFWSDDRGQADQLLRLAASLAREVEERHLLAVALSFRADLYSTVPYIGTVPNNTNLALTLFDEAASLEGPDTPPLLRSWVFGCRAEEHAILKRAMESDRDMERAHTALAAAPQGSGGGQVLDIAVMDIAAAAAGLSGFEGACAIALGRPREAREAFQAGLREQSSVGRLSGLAAALALEGDVEPAVELLTQGLDEAVRRQLPTRRRRVEGVRAAFLSHASDHPAVQRFDERLRAAIG